MAAASFNDSFEERNMAAPAATRLRPRSATPTLQDLYPSERYFFSVGHHTFDVEVHGSRDTAMLSSCFHESKLSQTERCAIAPRRRVRSGHNRGVSRLWASDVERRAEPDGLGQTKTLEVPRRTGARDRRLGAPSMVARRVNLSAGSERAARRRAPRVSVGDGTFVATTHERGRRPRQRIVTQESALQLALKGIGWQLDRANLIADQGATPMKDAEEARRKAAAVAAVHRAAEVQAADGTSGPSSDGEWESSDSDEGEGSAEEDVGADGSISTEGSISGASSGADNR